METTYITQIDHARKLEWLITNADRIKEALELYEAGKPFIDVSKLDLDEDTTIETKSVTTPEKIAENQYIFDIETFPVRLMKDYEISPYGSGNPLYIFHLMHYNGVTPVLTVVGNFNQIKEVENYTKRLTLFQKDASRDNNRFIKDMDRIYRWYMKPQPIRVSQYIGETEIFPLTNHMIKEYNNVFENQLDEDIYPYPNGMIGFPEWISKMVDDVKEMQNEILKGATFRELFAYPKTFKYIHTIIKAFYNL